MKLWSCFECLAHVLAALTIIVDICPIGACCVVMFHIVDCPSTLETNNSHLQLRICVRAFTDTKRLIAEIFHELQKISLKSLKNQTLRQLNVCRTFFDCCFKALSIWAF